MYILCARWRVYLSGLRSWFKLLAVLLLSLLLCRFYFFMWDHSCNTTLSCSLSTPRIGRVGHAGTIRVGWVGLGHLSSRGLVRCGADPDRSVC
ncbi:hypothetical protein QBC36DRAFT_330498 [Triangularia setosa]|uniref:Uncharacterized protein n=1 Tax=Triangularia setosa TaxID=2587417 RepID=A0AAN6W5M9_9PEZI|nr:hypothetical protein QBC36DRAFT_330498 [Podospora setosa]